LDPDKIHGKLRLRPWKTGDRIKPVGMKGSKRISDVLSDAKVSAHKKAFHLVLEDEKDILWCVGFSVSRIALATNKSRKLKVVLQLKKDSVDNV
jgi:tRNA(Ile)-lysidine synthase